MKMKIRNIVYILLLGAVFVPFSCTEEFTPALDSTFTRLIVDGVITTDTTVHRVILSKSGDALNKQPKRYVSGAVVSITDGSTVFPLSESSPGIYETQPDVFGLPGNTYTLNIANVDIDDDGNTESYSASSLLKAENDIDSIKIRKQVYGTQTYWLINMFARDIGGQSFYLVKAYRNNKLVTDSLKEYVVANNIGFEGGYYPGLSVYFLNSNKSDEHLNVGDTVTLELNGITEEYFNFINACILESRPKDPLFSGPSANVPTNIFPNDKAAGFFTAYSVKRNSTIYTEEKK